MAGPGPGQHLGTEPDEGRGGGTGAEGPGYLVAAVRERAWPSGGGFVPPAEVCRRGNNSRFTGVGGPASVDCEPARTATAVIVPWHIYVARTDFAHEQRAPGERRDGLPRVPLVGLHISAVAAHAMVGQARRAVAASSARLSMWGHWHSCGRSARIPGIGV